MAAVGVGVIVIDLLMGLAVRAILPLSNAGAGWVLRPLLLYGHTEHPGSRISVGTVVAVLGGAVVVYVAPRIDTVRWLVPCVAVGMGAGVANQIEVALRGSASDYFAFRDVPLLDSGVYNLADIEMLVGFLIGACALGWALLAAGRTPDRAR